MAGFRPHEQTECHVARDKFRVVAISYKYCHEPRGVSQLSFLLCNYYCRSNLLSNNPGYRPTDACRIDLIGILRNIVIHQRNLSFSGVHQHALPPIEIVTGRFVELPQDILINIFASLEFPDLVRVGSVCSSWNSAYTSICSFEQYKCSQAPCLIYTSESAGEHVAFLYSLVDKRAYKLTLPDVHIRRRYLIGSSHGWLVTADDRSEMHLVNPVTSEQISLPSVITIEQVTPILDETGAICRYSFSRHTAEAIVLRDRLFHKALLFYDTSAGSYFVVLIHNPFGQLSYARLGDDKWTWLPPHSHFDDCIYKDGLLYAVTLRGTVIAFDAPWGDLLQVRRPEIWISELPHNHGCKCCATFEETSWDIAVYKVCFATRKLVEINSLDDNVLFLGHNQSLCLRAEEYPHLKPNHIYFTDDCMSVSSKCIRGYRLIIGVFNIQTMRMGEIVSPQLWSKCMAPLWFIPNPIKI
ncbi:hypothetical protein HU200_009214 [Digitaria exilis]|uniref:F-box domain-containing protein n=1 Tax=Digitaria exilis TaxID=1010633 RepID=A0A835FK92_9POAL|nr:hypothetical protein HU200_009214 [Digitaria exilis]